MYRNTESTACGKFRFHRRARLDASCTAALSNSISTYIHSQPHLIFFEWSIRSFVL